MDKNLPKEAKKFTIPNKYLALAALGFASVISILFAMEIHEQSKQKSEADAPLAERPTLSAASRHVKESLKLDMPRSDVIRAMGKPDWAAIPGDKGPLSLPDDSFGLELRWDNPACRDVVVMFSPPPHRVIGWDDGSSYCATKVEADYEKFSCSQPDRQQFCQ